MPTHFAIFRPGTLSRITALATLVLVWEAVGLAQQAQNQANQGAGFQDGLAQMEAGRVNEAVAIWSQLAEQGNVESQYGLGLVYESGAPGIAADPLLAVSYYQRAAEGGLPEAQTNLGLLYAEGRGAIENQERAVALWTQAAKKNNAIAQFNLGLAYFSGRGIEADTDEALGLVLVAALQGLPQAHYAMGQFYLRGLGISQDEGLALAFLQQAKLGGNNAADSFVADLKARGVLEADLNDPGVQAKLPKLPRLVAQREILDDEAPTADASVASAAPVNVPRLPEQKQHQAPGLEPGQKPGQKTAGAGGNGGELPPVPLPLETPTAPSQLERDQATNSQATNSQAASVQVPDETQFETFDGSAPLINPALLAKGALDFSGLQLGNVDTQLLQPGQTQQNQTQQGQLAQSLQSGVIPAVPAPRVGGSGQPSAPAANGAGSLAAALADSAEAGRPLLRDQSPTALLDDSANGNDLLPAPLPLAAQNEQAQGGQRFGPLRQQDQNQVASAASQAASAASPPVGNASFQPSPEGMMILVGPKPPSVPFVLWVGTAETSKEGAELWVAALKAEPTILGGLEAILEPVSVGKKQAFRVLAGPIPDEKLGWQVCNAVKAGSLSFFCKVRAF